MSINTEEVTCWHDESIIVSGNPITRISRPAGKFKFAAYQSPSANGDEFKHYISLSAGTYTFIFLIYSTTSSGIFDWYLDSTKVISGLDSYVTGANLLTVAGIIVPSSNDYTLRGVVNGKNVLSSGYDGEFVSYCIRKE